jgi:hypothetical protein
MNKAAILVAMAILVGGSMVEQASSGKAWQDIFFHGATRQWLAVVILTAILLTMDDLGVGGIGLSLAVLIAAGYLLGGAGTLGVAIQNVVQAEWGK